MEEDKKTVALTGEALMQQRHDLHTRVVPHLTDVLVPADHPQRHIDTTFAVAATSAGAIVGVGLQWIKKVAAGDRAVAPACPTPTAATSTASTPSTTTTTPASAACRYCSTSSNKMKQQSIVSK